MRKILFFSILLFSVFSYCQEPTNDDFKKNELKGNALFFILGQPEFTYERILNAESGMGITLNFALENDFETKFSVTPFYRFYFGKKIASGFFIEGFSMLNSLDIPDETYQTYDFQNNTYTTVVEKGDQYIDFALGFGAGFKIISKRNLVLEINAGIGRNLFNAEKNDFYGHTFVGRGGLTVGYRF